ncbi:MAG TPA: hypothetical protein VMM92_13380, partial [Thermoanaerobaculia bacterium]|nr:hypothetical protein [Thermoanaerobaculia bacterium]
MGKKDGPKDPEEPFGKEGGVESGGALPEDKTYQHEPEPELPHGFHFRPEPERVTGRMAVTLQQPDIVSTWDQSLWVAVREQAHRVNFERYCQFIDAVMCGRHRLEGHRPATERLAFGADGYQLLKVATEAFLILHCGTLKIDPELYRPGEEAPRLHAHLGFEEISHRLSEYLQGGSLPYLRTVLRGLGEEGLGFDSGSPFCETLVCGRPFDPLMLELIWSYWHEEGMLVQAMNTVCLRFQNKLVGQNNALSQLELSPLRPLSNLLWGYIQDEPFRLSVARRAYEYSHHYGLPLLGKAVPRMRPADDRSKFLEAFHSLLRQVAIFYKEDADTTVIADGFPLLNSLQEVHLLLAEGAQNQFRDLPWTARVEMLIQKWLLSRREIQEFLRGRAMVPYKEPWMGPVDSLRRLLGWGDTAVTYFRDLGVYGEQILLSIRYGNWGQINDQDRPKNWARYFQPEIQGYLHAYRAVTGVDLGVRPSGQERVDATP